jgi:PAS domain S-box-containing protein
MDTDRMESDVEKTRNEMLRELSLLRRQFGDPRSAVDETPSGRASTAVSDIVHARSDLPARETHELLHAIVSKAPIVIWTLNTDGDFELIEGKALELLGLEPGEVIGRSVYDVYRDVPEVGKTIRRALAGETVAATLEIDDVVFETWQSPTRNAAGEVVGVVGLAVDVTRRRRAEAEVQVEHRLMRQMLRSHERDRRLVAYEIHDGMIQEAIAARMRLQKVLETSEDLPSDAKREIETASELMGRAISESRQLISGLRPPELDEVGIVAAVEYVIGQQPEGGPAFRFDADVRFERLEPVLEIAIFRIVQEAIANARRHAQSDRVEIRMTQRDGRVQLEIRDWGVGFDPASVAAECYGLQGMRERARLLGGRTEIKSAPGEGTRVYVELPLVPIFGEEADAES